MAVHDRPLPRGPVKTKSAEKVTVKAILSPSRYWNPGVDDEVSVSFTGRHWSTVSRPCPWDPPNGRIMKVERHISFSPSKTTLVATVEMFPGYRPPPDWDGLKL
jgi:hypothetical protein